MKRIFLVVINWFLVGVIAFTFLVLPDFIKSGHEEAPLFNWFSRIFFTYFLSNPFIGAAKEFNKPIMFDDYFYKYRNTDKDTLIITTYLVNVISFLLTTLVCYLGLTDYFLSIGWYRYLLTIIYGIFVGILHYTYLKMLMRRVRENNRING